MAFVDFTDEELQEALSWYATIKKDKANLKKVSLVAGYDNNIADYGTDAFNNAVEYVDKLQNARDNVTLEVIHDQEQYGDDTTFDTREWRYKNLYYLEITYIYSKKTYIVLSSALQFHIYDYLGNLEAYTPQVFEAGGSVDTQEIADQVEQQLLNYDYKKERFLNDILSINKVEDIFTQKIKDLLLLENSKILEQLAIKLIDYMHLNGVDFTYAPTIARVTIVNENGEIEPLDYYTENGVIQATADLNGRYTIQISKRDEL